MISGVLPTVHKEVYGLVLAIYLVYSKLRCYFGSYRTYLSVLEAGHLPSQKIMAKRVQKSQTATLHKRAVGYGASAIILVVRIYKQIKPIHLYILLCMAYMFSTSGVIYNLINTPPPYGMERVGVNESRPVFIASGMMTQYSTEGYVSGLLNLVRWCQLGTNASRVTKQALQWNLGFCLRAYFLRVVLTPERRFNKKTGM
ncbi:WD-repeat family protein [Giardia duodenalis assemblage B]|uniref:WD-repeat family protein n=1 Tax=Giardia duodenalis assemblage B TaxID=1394984 RepID=A0A132NXT6_GIAIN|nr:WD-repeat family protein [Giardia intestinalis assemblage B]